MDSVGIQLPPMLPESFYDIPAHSAGYSHYGHNPGVMWAREDTRGYATHGHGLEFESHIRHSNIQTNIASGPPIVSKKSSTEESRDCQSVEPTDWCEEDDNKEFSKTGSEQNSQKHSQVAKTLHWLSENYERAEGVCLPRCVLYAHYLDLCKKEKFTPAGAATFGKLIRQKFPKLTTRRLGTRGQSKYHYYGIGIKETSIYYHSVYSGKGLTRFSGIKIKTEGSNRKYSLSSKTGTLLPEFPDSDNLILPDDVSKEKMTTFIMMYRTHCQRILDTVVSANFEEVQNFLLHFWQGMPEHLVGLMKAAIVADVIGFCDSILYQVLIDVLIPSSIQDMPDSLSVEIRVFAKKLPFWIENSMETVPDHLKVRKLNVVKTFIQSIKRQINFVHLAQTARTVLLNHENITQMLEDLGKIDFPEICCHAGFMEPETASRCRGHICDFFEEFQTLLSKQAPIEGYTEWLDNVIDKCVLQPSKDKKSRQKEKAAEFLLHWAAFGSLLLRDLTLHNAKSFGSFHLIHMMFDEYVFLVMETQQEQELEKELQQTLQKHMRNAEEIKMQPKLRNASGKSQISPKTKKRKHGDDQFDSNDEAETNHMVDEKHQNTPVDLAPLNGTAFSRPAPSNNRANNDHFSLNLNPEDSVRSGGLGQGLQLSPLKPFQAYNNSSYDRPTYIPQLGSYSDYVNSGPSLAPPRISTYPETQTISSVGLSSNLSQVNGNYWSDNRGHHSFSDHYSPYAFNKMSATYDGYNKSSFLSRGPYHDSMNKSAFDASRGYYRSSHDNFQASLPVGTYGGNFMDVSPNPAQYCRQDGVFYQDEVYPCGMASSFSSFGKPYLTAPFR
ncbi:hypothetical protein ACJMK2_020701 [Sinanodonta woodiana]|uniref:DNA-binding protein RFX6 n=1 Tax=Sinanodonta woodiana TaxID=1069815 RepID=A0ABD3U2I5_SINWO